MNWLKRIGLLLAVLVGCCVSSHAQCSTLTPTLSLQVPTVGQMDWGGCLNFDLTQIDSYLKSLNANFNNIIFVDGVTYPRTDTGIYAAVSALLAVSPNGGTVVLPPGTYTIFNPPLLINAPIFLQGQGQGGPTFAGPSPAPVTIFTCAAGVSCVHFSSVSDAGNRLSQGGGMDRIAIFGNDNVNYGLEITGWRSGQFTNLFIVNATTSGIKLDPVAVSGDSSRDVQSNVIANTKIEEGGDSSTLSADDIELTGDSSANSSENHLQNLWLIHKNGIGINDSNGDNNTIDHIAFTQLAGGSGVDVHLTGSGTINTAAREEHLSNIDGSPGGILQDGTANGNAIIGYTTCNGGPLPVISAGVASQLVQGCDGAFSDNFMSVPRLVFGSDIRGFEGNAPAVGASYDVCYADATAHALKCSYNNGTFGQVPTAPNLLTSVTAPTIASGFGSSPSIVQQNGTAAFEVNVGTGGSATSGVIGLPTAANGWGGMVCYNRTAHAANRADDTVVTAYSATSVTVQNQTKSTGAAVAWTASDHVQCSGGAF